MRTAWSPATVATHVVGNALVLHARDEISADAQVLALEVKADPDHVIVVLDLHADLPPGIWEVIAEVLGKGRRPLRVILCGTDRETAVLAGQWLADRLDRTVVAPDGKVVLGSSGGLFVHAGEGSGWIRYEPGRPPSWTAKRYPAPAWDALVAESLPTSAGGVADPLPGGVWLHRTGDTGDHGDRLAASMPCQPDSVTVVVGCPGTPALTLDDVARFWRSLGDQARDQVRFVRYGEVQLPEGVSFGQALADLLGILVVCLAGIPEGRPARPTMHTVTADGSPGWQAFARELRYQPRPAPGSPGEAPLILGYRAPEELGEQIAPGQFRYATDTVVEIVESGLWVRGEALPTDASRPRGRAMNPDELAVLVDDAEPDRVSRLYELAEDLVGRLDPGTQQRVGFYLASTMTPLGTYAAASANQTADQTADQAAELPEEATAEASASAAPVPEVASPAPAPPPAVQVPALVRVQVPLRVQITPAVPEPEPEPEAPAFFFHATPEPSCRAVPDPRMIADDRTWLSETFGPQYAAARNSVERILAAYPGFEAEPDLVADAVAVHLFLSEFGVGLSEALRDGEFGPQVPFARCVASGMARMPEHRGPAHLVADLTAEQLGWIARRPILTEWGFTEALAQPADLSGTVDVFIWSAHGRRTQPLETDGEHCAEGRVVFLPGTRFQMLRAVAPAGAVRGRLLLRQLSPGTAPDPLSEDIIVAELERIAEQWVAATPHARVGRAARQRLQAVPGVR